MLKRALRRVWCWLTGGHRYKDADLVVHYDELHMEYHFSNACVKCGADVSVRIPEECIIKADTAYKQWEESCAMHCGERKMNE